jgi:hypothetical protein
LPERAHEIGLHIRRTLRKRAIAEAAAPKCTEMSGSLAPIKNKWAPWLGVEQVAGGWVFGTCYGRERTGLGWYRWVERAMGRKGRGWGRGIYQLYINYTSTYISTYISTTKLIIFVIYYGHVMMENLKRKLFLFF